MFFLALALAALVLFLHHTTIGRFILLNLLLFLLILPNNHLDHLIFLIVFLLHHFLFLLRSATPHPLFHGLKNQHEISIQHLLLALFHFCYVQTVINKTRGIKRYIKDFFKPFFIMLPLNVIGKLSSIISISFRLIW